MSFPTRWGECTGGIQAEPGNVRRARQRLQRLRRRSRRLHPRSGNARGPAIRAPPDGVPLTPYLLHGRDFFHRRRDGLVVDDSGRALRRPHAQLPELHRGRSQLRDRDLHAQAERRLHGDHDRHPGGWYAFHLHLDRAHPGAGLRIEMCYPESSVQDLDLYVKQPGHKTPWFTELTQFSTALDQCSWANCEATLRGGDVTPAQTVTRADWGYPTSPLSLCEHDLQGATWFGLGYCASPRLDIDNNLSEATGVPENINVDAPGDNETFRIMVANFSGPEAHPLVNVYCDGRRVATLGAPPDQVLGFTASGEAWRSARFGALPT